MSDLMQITSPGLLEIRGAGGGRWKGGSQEWYASGWKRRAGCGPTTASHLLWYLSRRPGLEALCPWDASAQGGFVRLMDAVWGYVTPGMKGVNSTTMLLEGAVRYARDQGVSLRPHEMKIPRASSRRPGWDTLCHYFGYTLGKDLPLAFLNLSNGAVKNLDSWHWVTLVSVDSRQGAATMYDQGIPTSIDLALWLRSTTLGGGFVALSPEGS